VYEPRESEEWGEARERFAAITAGTGFSLSLTEGR
jgi:hypothetical protein